MNMLVQFASVLAIQMPEVTKATVLITVVGLVIGIFLGFAAKFFELKEEKRHLNPNIIVEETFKRIKKIEENIIMGSENRKVIKNAKKKAYQKGLIINFNNDYYNSYLELREILDKHYIQKLSEI